MENLSTTIRRSVGNERHRFLQLATGVWGATLVSNVYAFGLIAHHMKADFHLSQQQLATISTVAVVAGSLVIIAGAIFDKWGPRFVDLFATASVSCGFLVYGLLFAGVIQFRMSTIIATTFFISWPTAFFDIGTLMPNLFTFPLDRGSIVMLQKTFMGLGSAFLSIIYVSFFHNDVQHYCYFVAGLTIFFGLGAALFAQVPAYERLREKDNTQIEAFDEIDAHILNVRADKKRLMIGFVLLWLCLVFFMASSIIFAVVDGIPSAVFIAVGVAAVLIMLSFLSMGLIPDTWLCRNTASDDNLNTENEESKLIQETPGNLLHQQESTVPQEASASTNQNKTVSEEDAPPHDYPRNMKSFLQNLLGIDLWLLWYITCSVWGTNIIMITNTPQIYRAANDNHYNAKVNSMYVALIGIGSALGRIVAGNLEQRLLKKHIPVTILFPVPAVMTAVAFALFLVVPSEALFLPFMLGSFGFGVSWAVIVLAMRLMHGKDVGKNYNFLFTGPTVSVVAFNRPMFGYFYDQIGREQHNYPNCAGKECYRNTFLLFLGLNVLAIGAGLLAHSRWMKNYFTKTVNVA